MFAIPDFVNLRAKFNSFSKLINLVIRISLNGCGVIIVVFFLEDLFINGIKVLHDILFLSEFSHKLREWDRSEEILRFLIFIGMIDLFGHKDERFVYKLTIK